MYHILNTDIGNGFFFLNDLTVSDCVLVQTCSTERIFVRHGIGMHADATFIFKKPEIVPSSMPCTIYWVNLAPNTECIMRSLIVYWAPSVTYLVCVQSCILSDKIQFCLQNWILSRTEIVLSTKVIFVLQDFCQTKITFVDKVNSVLDKIKFCRQNWFLSDKMQFCTHNKVTPGAPTCSFCTTRPERRADTMRKKYKGSVGLHLSINNWYD